eukprot:TRINITY_DN10935_c0_g1_i2.p2 TRINITY_DN10935_c0_g1~~TRINITY_DN10935_c0_g1_i2.p2  ORF type:complete len:165 (+),score=48.06 TRINITY_DN10935_c0_g1_i2:70-564(+)
MCIRDRAKMANWMIEVTSLYECEHQTFFLANEIMDRFYAFSKTSYDRSDIHLTGLVCTFIASKLVDFAPLRMKQVYKHIGYKKFSVRQIKEKEQCVLRTVGFNLLFPTCFNLAEYFIEKFSKDHRIDEEYWPALEKLKKYCAYGGKLAKHEYQLLKYRYSSHNH